MKLTPLLYASNSSDALIFASVFAYISFNSFILPSNISTSSFSDEYCSFSSPNSPEILSFSLLNSPISSSVFSIELSISSNLSDRSDLLPINPSFSDDLLLEKLNILSSSLRLSSFSYLFSLISSPISSNLFISSA